MSRTMQIVLLLMTVALPTTVAADEGDAALMKACPGLAIWAAAHPRSSAKPDRGDLDGRVTEPSLRTELARRSADDQRVRNALIAAHGGDSALGKEAVDVDGDNLRWLKAVVGKQGFPTADQVGKSGVHDAWLLVQHADSDPGFQTVVLERLKPLVVGGDVSGQEFAMLTDRVLRHQGKPQRYGSQFAKAKDGRFVQDPTEDVAHVEQRRAAVGLMPLAAYRCVLNFTFNPPAKSASGS